MGSRSPRQIQIIKLAIFAVVVSVFFGYVKMEDVIKFFTQSRTQAGSEWDGLWKSKDPDQNPDADIAVQEVRLDEVYYPTENSNKIAKEKAAWERNAAQNKGVTQETSKTPYVDSAPPPDKRTGVHDAEAVTNSDNQEFAARRKAAEQGNARAQFEMGEAYHDGAGVEVDPKEAIKWYRKAAEQGQPEAQDRLGTAYHEGWGVRRDETAAINWWRKAADQGNPHAQQMLNVNNKKNN